MGNKKKNYVSAKKVKSIQADYILLLGERANGKSYCVKNILITECYKRDIEFIYLRRYDLDVKDSVAVNYFADVPVYEITAGEYSCIDVFRKGIYFANVDEETGRTIRGKKIGHCHALSGAEHYKSLSFPKVEYIVYEEFISVDGHYLYQEAESKLQHYVSTIFRHRRGKVYLIGNTISRICPYMREWGLERGLRTQKQGEIKMYKIGDTTIAVYLTDSLNYNSGMFFGHVANNITKGDYETLILPHLPKPKYRYKTLYQFILQYDSFKFLCELLQDNEKANNITWYIQPKTSEIQKKTRVISNQYNIDPYYTTTFKGLTANEKQVIELLLNDQVCYSDNLTGTEFINILKNFK